MKKNVKLILVTSLMLTSTLASAAALCPPSSCNPHNGCMDGCYTFTASGSAACTPDDAKIAENEAIKTGTNFAAKSCYYGFFMTTPWHISTLQDASKCVVNATANFSCID